MTKRERDERDLKILDTLEAGGTQRGTAAQFGVSVGYLQNLLRAWRATT